MKKLKLTILMGVFLYGTSFGGVIPDVPDGGYPVIDVTSIGKLSDQYDRMKDQLDQQTYAAERLQKEINSIGSGQFKDTADIQALLDKTKALIKQAESMSYAAYSDGSQFSKNYKGYSTESESLKTPEEYDAMYSDNVNTTLQTIKNANNAIDQDLNDPDASPDNISDKVESVKRDIETAEGTNQAVGGLAEINAQILKQLQQIHTQLAAMAESQNAIAGKEIQEDATVAKAVRTKLDKDAVSVSANYGDHPINTPNL